MRLHEILAASNAASSFSDAQRHDWLKFIHAWLSGSVTGGNNTPAILEKWREFSRIFPPKPTGQKKLYRLVTLPISYAEEKKEFDICPSPWPVSSWASNLRGIDCVAGVARDQRGEAFMHSTTRLAIEARIDGSAILADYRSIKKAVVAFSHDYFDRYPEQEDKAHPDYPGGDDQEFDINEVGFMQDVVANQPGGWYRQYEHIVETPKIVTARVVRIYRIGREEIRAGNDDPHN